MREIEPEFDGQWFVRLSDCVVEAPTLAQLRQKLGSGYVIVGYYPEGYKTNRVIAEPKKENSRSSEEPIKVDEPVSLEAATRIQTRSNLGSRRYDHEAVLDLWDKGYTGPEIAQMLEIPNWKRLGDILSRYRKLGDPRAHSRKQR